MCVFVKQTFKPKMHTHGLLWQKRGKIQVVSATFSGADEDVSGGRVFRSVVVVPPNRADDMALRRTSSS